MEGKDLTAYNNEIAQMVKEKTGRAMQTKERTVINKKTGKTKIVNGSSPLRESVVVCKQDTTIDQLKKYCDRCHVESQPCKSSSIRMKVITAYRATTPHGNRTAMPISYGTG